MTALQHCPDNLLARARAGTLSSPERRQLQEHLGQCETCRVSLLVGKDFDGALGARSDDTLLVARVVDAVRAFAARRASVAPAVRRGRRPSERPVGFPAGRPRSRVFLYGVAAALLTISCVVGAARPSVRRTLAVFFGLQARELRYEVPADVASRSASKEVKRAPLVDPEAPVAAPVAEVPLAPPEERAPPARRAHGMDAPRAEPPEVPLAASAASAAKELFAQANAKRRAGDEVGAKRLYQELQHRHPQSPEAQVSYVALGRLLLERSQDPKGALEQFDRALDPPGPSDRAGLVEEALFGRATALQRLGRTADERKTWLGLLERFPGSVYADRARGRLNEINLVVPRTADPAGQH